MVKIIKKYTSEKTIFSTYLHVLLLKFQLGALVGWGIQFRIQRVPTWHTFGGPRSTKNKKYMKKRDVDVSVTFFHVFLVFHGEGSTKSMSHVYSLDAELNCPSNEFSRSKFE